MNLGNCKKCGNRLAVKQQNKYRLQGDVRVLLDEDGKDLKQDQKGRLSGRPAREWVVCCSDCEREYRDHPYQKELDAKAAEAKNASPPPPVFMGANHYTELSTFDLLDRRITALEAALPLAVVRIEKQIEDLFGEIASLRNELAAGKPAGKPKLAAAGKG